ncbi:pyridoxamine 5'-phosphate oxidase family protein [Myxococcus sp. AM009]|uniref:pyridoxamine 5'-phosphate oxidase family protein n=1 Tax=unclassified Myxococcus TaxID=2648731 RepID=UPI001595E8F7|nr:MULTISPECIES: pyridoxamine 5'-phosphate oxidase family protein [unclassified Myxococcus]NVI99928.1 pyridoxamine 5'-phosphate oxidase family protein [Myxococcus sp. AM009]NVJ17960.1 pyridoxamine 5'-phosphate oxidase family protein [Myxococcus sp. AM010]
MEETGERTMNQPRGAIQGDRREFEELLKGHDTALLTTRGADGHFHTRPMAVAKKHKSGTVLWFATWTDTQKVQDLESDPHCSLAFHATEDSATYLSVSGVVEIVRDRRAIHDLWEPGWKPWFPQGPDEGDIALLRFTPEHAEYVHPAGGKLKVLFSTAKALVTKQRPDIAPKKELDLH